MKGQPLTTKIQCMCWSQNQVFEIVWSISLVGTQRYRGDSGVKASCGFLMFCSGFADDLVDVLLGFCQGLTWEKLNRGVSKPTFLGKVQIVSQTPFGTVPRARKRKGPNRENPRTIPEQIGKIREKSGKAQKDKKGRTSADREAPPFETPPVWRPLTYLGFVVFSGPDPVWGGRDGVTFGLFFPVLREFCALHQDRRITSLDDHNGEQQWGNSEGFTLQPWLLEVAEKK